MKVRDLSRELRATFYRLKIAFYEGDDTALEAILDFLVEHDICSPACGGFKEAGQPKARREWHLRQRQAQMSINAQMYHRLLQRMERGEDERPNW